MPSRFSRKRRYQLVRRRSICSSLQTVRLHKIQVIAVHGRTLALNRIRSAMVEFGVRPLRSTKLAAQGTATEHSSPYAQPWSNDELVDFQRYRMSLWAPVTA
jgi:hypothetical protein